MAETYNPLPAEQDSMEAMAAQQLGIRQNELNQLIQTWVGDDKPTDIFKTKTNEKSPFWGLDSRETTLSNITQKERRLLLLQNEQALRFHRMDKKSDEVDLDLLRNLINQDVHMQVKIMRSTDGFERKMQATSMIYTHRSAQKKGGFKVPIVGRLFGGKKEE